MLGRLVEDSEQVAKHKLHCNASTSSWSLGQIVEPSKADMKYSISLCSANCQV